jgi:hypothetical protein
MSADDILYAPILPTLKVGTVVIDGDGRRMTLVDIADTNTDYLTCAWSSNDGTEVRANFWRSSIKIVEG